MNRRNRLSRSQAAALLFLGLGPWLARAAEPEDLPPTPAVMPQPPAPAEHAGPKSLPIDLATVLKLTLEQNLQIAEARAKVAEAEAKADLACKKCFPPKQHAINTVMAEENVWKQKAELSRITADTLFDAGATYIDLLTARAGRGAAEGLLNDLNPLLARASKAAAKGGGSPEKLAEARVQTEIAAREANLRRFDAQVAAASAKLIYLMALDSCTVLLPIDSRLEPISLIDATTPVCDLIARAVTQGPGIHDLEGLVAVTDDAASRSHLSYFLIYCRVACEARRVAEAQQAEAHLAYDELRAKLTAGVQESREEIVNGSEEIRRSGFQMSHAREAHRQSEEILKADVNVISSITDVLVSLQSLGGAQVNHLHAIRDYNKAQLRLLILTTEPGGPGGPCPPNGSPVAAHPADTPPNDQLPTPQPVAK